MGLPVASIRSVMLNTFEVIGVDFLAFMSNRFMRFWSPITSKSSKPFVMNNVTFAPFFSKRALVPRVVARCMLIGGSGLLGRVQVDKYAASIGASRSNLISIDCPIVVFLLSGSDMCKIFEVG